MIDTQNTERLLDVRGLTVEIDGRNGPAVVVDGIDLHVDRGETLGIVGESGCGKSLTMLSLMRLLPNKIKVTKGTATFNGRDLQTMSNAELRKVRGGDIGFVFQDPMTSLNPVMRVGAQICEPLIYHRGMKKAEARARAVELLRLVGIPGPEERLQAFPHELSGGMRQRVMIAIGLACNPKLLIADEPTTALDVTIQAQIVDLVKHLRTKLGMSVVWITHDLALIAGLVDRVAVLYAGMVVEDAPVDDLYARPSHPYTRGLLSSIPKLSDPPASRLSSIGGTPPEPGRRPKGCPFAPRCPLVEAICHENVPQLEPLSGSSNHRAACFVVQRMQEAA
ncbi:oligopeptide/dipeptide ABC transporter, ATP-binding protein [Rhizobium leguminosarum bv. trifolii WSM2297]|uniref:Oligopeptide/dipeptide ABC transporter, ATP-binding protein n=1 Tax=Rhizobium leguminosarum bv. trifolii WSM2297 TaxID=754762 RepID=J0CWQ6_RHILT|nr:ABC transporter ATP-binding protein [Rhizobium leguminosarum]EJC84024.1 oligopeptide/dipeptide ABC transporter, ATP-binding protein [Rhizobium leguminosarum bv. trifolii WSM2297]EJC84385.1 oligopeptide/dipeptide ABC transporter, ATP-binding protein [Rhizobium leguminosarum bv. trifolii WSM2297]